MLQWITCEVIKPGTHIPFPTPRAPVSNDVYVAMLDASRKEASPLVVRRPLTVPDFWNDHLSLSTVMLVSDVHALKTAFSADEQSEHAYAFGRAEIVPAAVPRCLLRRFFFV